MLIKKNMAYKVNASRNSGPHSWCLAVESLQMEHAKVWNAIELEKNTQAMSTLVQISVNIAVKWVWVPVCVCVCNRKRSQN